MFKKIVAGLLAVGLLLTTPFSTAQAEEDKWPSGPDIVSPCAIVMEVNTGTILYEKNIHEQHYPASITKVLTTLLAVENCTLDETVVFSADAVFKNEGDTSHIARDLNEELTMEQTLYAVMLESANECAYAAAEHVGEKMGGDYQTFIDMMNEKATELGCLNSHFNNANGLPDPTHVTTAYDMALIARAAYQNETFRIITGTKKYTIPVTNKKDEPYYCRNHHRLLYPYKTAEFLYDYCTGGKTGYTDISKSTLVTYAEKDGMTLVCVILYTSSPNQFKDTITLMDYCFEEYKVMNIAENDSNIATESTESNGIFQNYEEFATLDKNAYVVLPKSSLFEDVTSELIYDEEDKQQIAKLQYTYGGKVVGCAEIVASNATVEENYFEKAQQEPQDEVKVIEIQPWYIVLAVIGVIVLITFIILGKRFYDNYYVIRHNWEVKKLRKQRFKEVRNRKSKYRRKDRLFY